MDKLSRPEIRQQTTQQMYDVPENILEIDVCLLYYFEIFLIDVILGYKSTNSRYWKKHVYYLWNCLSGRYHWNSSSDSRLLTHFCRPICPIFVYIILAFVDVTANSRNFTICLKESPVVFQFHHFQERYSLKDLEMMLSKNVDKVWKIFYDCKYWMLILPYCPKERFKLHKN